MKIADLQNTLRDLCRLLESAGTAAAKVGELTTFADDLEAHKELTLKAFITAISRATTEGTGSRGSGRGRRSDSVPAVNPDAVRDEAKRLYERAPGGIDESELKDLEKRLSALKVEDIRSVAAGLEFRPTAKENTKAKLVSALYTLIEKRAGASIRRNLINRSAQPQPEGVPVTP